MQALNLNWHQECFVCHVCGKSITGNFFIIEGKRKCELCYGVTHTCFTCGKPLIGPFFFSMMMEEKFIEIVFLKKIVLDASERLLGIILKLVD